MENKSGIHPTGDMVLVQPLTVEETTEAGIVIPKTQTDREQMAVGEGVVIEYGSTALKSPRMLNVEPGTLIGFAKWAGQPKTGQDEIEYRLIRGDDVICTLEAPSLSPIKARIPLNPQADGEFDIA